ncbi:replication protein A 70 kDa DNA-binding subunit B, partial [Tanacetum coccineum]
GNHVQGTIMNQNINKFQLLIDEGSCYRISNFGVGDNGGKYPLLNHRYKLNFYKNTTVTRVANFDNNTRGFKFEPFSNFTVRKFFETEVVDVIGTVVSITNLIPFNNYGKEFQPFGRLVDAFIANKRLKIGKRFGFVRFLGVRNEEDFVKVLSNIWIWSFHVYIATAKFQRQPKQVSSSVPKTHARPDHQTQTQATLVRLNGCINVPFNFPANHSYASVANGNVASKDVSNNGVHVGRKRIQLTDRGLIKVEDTFTVA